MRFSLTIFLAIVVSFATQAQFSVNSSADSPDVNPGDGVCADASGNCSLRAAVMEANALPGSNVINLPNGTYLFTLVGANENAAATGDLDVTDDLEVIGTDARQTIINADSLDRVFHVLAGADLVLEHLELREGSVLAANGGALLNEGSATLRYCAIKNCQAEGASGSLAGGGGGGAIYTSGNLVVLNSTLESNTALGGRGANGVSPGGGSGGGGAPGLGGAIFGNTGSVISMINCTLSGNTAQGGRGGNGTFHQGSGTVASAGGNGGGSGGSGGAPNAGGAPGGWGGGGGGGASLSGAGGAGGFGGGGGGGGANSWGGNAGPAGAAGQHGGAGGQGCCSAGSGGGGGAGLGGAIFFRGSSLDLTSVTIAFNTCSGGIGGNGYFSGNGAAGQAVGGGIYRLSGTVNVDNCLFAENSATAGPSLYGTFNSNAGHNLVQSTDVNLVWTGSTAGNIENTDPLILPLENNGGETDTHRVQSCNPISPAIDAASSSAPAQDQIDQPRIATADIGALESPSAVAVFLPADTVLCIGQTLLLDVTAPDATYLWSDGSTDPTLFVDAAGAYEVTITQNGCSQVDAITVEISPLDVVDLGEDVVLCPNDAVTLDAGYPGATFVWQDGSTNQTLTTTEPGTYTVEVTLGYCSASDAVEVALVETVDPALGLDIAFCDGEQATLETTLIADEYAWSSGETDNSIVVNESGTYMLEVTVNNCVFSDEVEVVVYPLPVVDLGEDQTICEGESVDLVVTTTGSVEWQDGSATTTFTASEPGLYSAIVTENGCSSQDELTLFVNPVPVFELGEDQTTCYNANLTLEVVTGLDGVDIEWSTGAVTPEITVQTSGVYQALASIGDCFYSDEVEVFVIPALTLDLGPDITACKETVVTLSSWSPLPESVSYLWSDGSTLPSLEVTATDTYTVSVENECEVVVDQIEVYFEQCGCLVYVPNAFTPDQDGVNEVFKVESSCTFDTYQLQIFNRWGEVVFSTGNPDDFWTGNVSGGAYYAPDMAYVWYLEYTSTTLEGTISEKLSGHVVVLR